MGNHPVVSIAIVTEFNASLNESVATNGGSAGVGTGVLLMPLPSSSFAESNRLDRHAKVTPGLGFTRSGTHRA